MTPPDEKTRRKLLAAAFRMPAVQTMVSRKSSITNAFVNSVIPSIPPTHDEIEQALAILGMDIENVRCAYCGDRKTEWDHLRPLVIGRRPTGYISEIGNLVPACGKCNQSKGNKPWRVWILSDAPRSPTGRGIADIAKRIARLEDFERWKPATTLDLETIVGREDWEKYWDLCEAVNAELRQCQDVANTILARIIESLKPKA